MNAQNEQQVNAGGILSADEIIGRNAFIRFAWATLEKQGLYLTGERRMGKSSIVRDKMGTQPPPGYKLVYLDVSDADTPLVFVDNLFREAKKIGDANSKFKLNSLDILRRLVPKLEIASLFRLPESLAPSWKELLHAVLADFAAHTENQIVLAFDELPIMIDNIKRKEGEAAAMDVLNTLRKERQSDKRLRMIYTGSLGLHHILTRLQDVDYQNAPINDLRHEEVKPLTPDFATDLAWRLINGMEIGTSNPQKLARHVADITSGIPYYIQCLMGDLASCGEDACEPETADRLLASRLTDFNDPWDLGYYVKRIKTHYQPKAQPMALAFLDQLAFAPEALYIDDILNRLDPQKVSVNEDAAPQILELLGKDHYITLNEDRAYQFRYPIIARAWVYKRGLQSRKGR